MSRRQGGFEGEVGLSPGVELQKSDCSLPAGPSVCRLLPLWLLWTLRGFVEPVMRICMCVCCGMQALRVGVQNSRLREYPGTYMVSRGFDWI